MVNGTLSVSLGPEAVEAVARRLAELLGESRAPSEPLLTRQLAVSVAEAAGLLSISPDHFRRHVLPDLHVIRSGRLRLIAVTELERWLADSASRVLADELRTRAPLAHDPAMPHSRAV